MERIFNFILIRRTRSGRNRNVSRLQPRLFLLGHRKKLQFVWTNSQSKTVDYYLKHKTKLELSWRNS
jgi:hypothetical protein